MGRLFGGGKKQPLKKTDRVTLRCPKCGRLVYVALTGAYGTCKCTCGYTLSAKDKM